MAKSFKKGDRVFYVGKWSSDGAACFEEAIVYSCGNVQMVLTSAADGHELGRNYSPVIANFGCEGTIPVTTIEARDAHILEISRLTIERLHVGIAKDRRDISEKGKKYGWESAIVDFEEWLISPAPRFQDAGAEMDYVRHDEIRDRLAAARRAIIKANKR